MLTIDNPDAIGVRELGLPETLDFWEATSNYDLWTLFADRFYGDENTEECDRLHALIEDYRRVNEQCDKLKLLNPEFSSKYDKDLAEAVLTLEKSVVKILGTRVKFEPHPT